MWWESLCEVECCFWLCCTKGDCRLFDAKIVIAVFYIFGMLSGDISNTIYTCPTKATESVVLHHRNVTMLGHPKSDCLQFFYRPNNFSLSGKNFGLSETTVSLIFVKILIPYEIKIWLLHISLKVRTGSIRLQTL